MWTKETKEKDDVAPLGTTDTVAAYEEAMKEFATSAAEFLEHIALLTKARDSYQRAMSVSTRLRGRLDKGDELLRTLMTKVEEAIDAQAGKETSDTKKPAPAKVETIRAAGEKADTARA
jgi:exonuclease VII small subunit